MGGSPRSFAAKIPHQKDIGGPLTSPFIRQLTPSHSQYSMKYNQTKLGMNNAL
jgi:hypothetical protein